MEQKFSKGAIVRLRSGGPKMTVTEYDPDPASGGKYNCRWFNEQNQTFQFNTFNECELDGVPQTAGTGGASE